MQTRVPKPDTAQGERTSAARGRAQSLHRILHGRAADRGADRKDPVQQSPSPAPGSEAQAQPLSQPADVAITGLRGAGEPLAERDRAFFEPRIGQPLEQVRVHTGAAAQDAADRINARAFTLGQDIAFARGAYQPQTQDGRRLLAHELAHVRQGIAQVIRRETAAQRQTRVERATIQQLTAAITLLRSAQGLVQGRGLSALAGMTTPIASGLASGRYGVRDVNGRPDPAHRAEQIRIRQNFRLPGQVVSRPFEFRLRLFLSHETGATQPAGTYTPEGNLGGRLTFFINTLSGASTLDVLGIVAHEFFHMWAHYQRVVRDRYGDAAAAQAPSAQAARVVDPTSFSAHRRRMEAHFRRLLRYLRDQARSRSPMPIRYPDTVAEVASSWGRHVVEEIGAYTYEGDVTAAASLAQSRAASGGSGGGAVMGVGRAFGAVPFLNRYITRYWLHDAGDRAALRQPDGQRILQGMSTDVNALQRAMIRYMA